MKKSDLVGIANELLDKISWIRSGNYSSETLYRVKELLDQIKAFGKEK